MSGAEAQFLQEASRLHQCFAYFETEPTRVALREPLERVLCLMAARFQREAIGVRVEVPDDLPLIWGVADRMAQVFLNVLINAWHAVPNGGTVTIQARVLDDSYVQMTVCDTGVGMPAAELARACEPFFSTKDDKGSGLGLAICQQILETHHGTIDLQSTPGVGTTVTMRWLRADSVYTISPKEAPYDGC